MCIRDSLPVAPGHLARWWGVLIAPSVEDLLRDCCGRWSRTDLASSRTHSHAAIRACPTEGSCCETKISAAVGWNSYRTVSYTHLRAHETVLDLVCRLLLEKKKKY